MHVNISFQYVIYKLYDSDTLEIKNRELLWKLCEAIHYKLTYDNKKDIEEIVRLLSIIINSCNYEFFDYNEEILNNIITTLNSKIKINNFVFSGELRNDNSKYEITILIYIKENEERCL